MYLSNVFTYIVLDRLTENQLTSAKPCPIKFSFGHFNLPKPCHDSVVQMNSTANQGEDAFIVSDR